MKIVFIGKVKFSQKMLEKRIQLNANIVGVCTNNSSNFNSDSSNLVPICKQHNIPYKLVDDINSNHSFNWINNLAPDVIFCFGWSSLIKRKLLNLPALGVLGFHPTKLPSNRGRHPLIWSLILGLKKSASTFFFMDEGADSGDILSQKNFDILDTDNANSLYHKVTNIASTQVEEFLPKLQKKTFTKIKQKHSLANTWRKRNFDDGKIDFRMNSEAIYNLVRALSYPYVGAHVVYKNSNVIIWDVKKIILDSKDCNIECGKVLDQVENRIIVKTYDGAVEILKHEFAILPKKGEYL